MSTTPNGLVENLKASRLLTDEQLDALTASTGDDPARIITSLNQSRWITPWQLRVVESGASGPFQLGDYLLLDRLEQGPVAGSFVARHLPSGHPVLLQFVAGDGTEAERLWPLVERSVTRLAPVRHPGVLEVFAAVELSEFAFVATELPAGKSLGELLPAGKKTKSAQAAMIVAQVARAVQACHSAGIVHGQIGMDSVWLASKNLVRLRLNPMPLNPPLPEWLPPELRSSGAASVAGDAWQLGCLFCRLVSGKLPAEAPAAGETVEAGGIVRLLAQEKVPAELQELASSLLAGDPTRRIGKLENAAAVFASAAGDAGVPAESGPIDSLLQLRRFAERDRATGDGPVIVGRALDSSVESRWAALGTKADGPGLMVKTGLDRAGRSRSAGRWWPWAAMTASLGLLAAAIVIFRPDNGQVASRNGSAEPAPNVGEETGQPAAVDSVDETGTADDALAGDGDPATSSTSTTGSGVGSRQAVVPDDGSMLWESPTSGPMLDASGLPPAPRMVFSLRCRELAGQPEFQRLLAQSGSGPSSLAAELESVTGLKLVEVAQLLVGVYPSPDPAKYELFLVARLPEAVSRETLVAALSLEAIVSPEGPAADGGLKKDEPEALAENADSTVNRNPRESASASGSQEVAVVSAQAEDESQAGIRVGKGLFRRSGRAVALLNRGGAAGESVDTVCVGSGDLMDAALASGANVVADGTFGRLAAISDDERLVTAMIVPAALFNDAGQSLTTGTWAPVFERLAALADDSLRTVMVSVDLNGGCFVEAALDHSVDLRPDAALEKLRTELRGLRASAADGLAATPGHPWWEKVRLQLTGMLHLLSRQTRTGIENDLVVANCWLPEIALHNLVGGSELALGGMRGAGGTGDSPVAEPATAGPQTIEDLLRLPRSLEVTTNPDLGVLLQGIEDEVNNEQGGLGFRFRIRVEGPDLLKQGITQNQRPGNFSISDKPLADMLTEIMFRANPNKTASGPNDPLCELVWVVAPDPEQPGQKMVQVTTRTASEEKMQELPPAFRLD